MSSLAEIRPVLLEFAPPVIAFWVAFILAMIFVHEDFRKARFDVFRIWATWVMAI